MTHKRCVRFVGLEPETKTDYVSNSALTMDISPLFLSEVEDETKEESTYDIDRILDLYTLVQKIRTVAQEAESEIVTLRNKSAFNGSFKNCKLSASVIEFLWKDPAVCSSNGKQHVPYSFTATGIARVNTALAAIRKHMI